MVIISFFSFLDNSFLFDFDFLDLVSVKTVREFLGHILLFSSEGVQIFSFSDFEFGHSLVLLDEDG